MYLSSPPAPISSWLGYKPPFTINSSYQDGGLGSAVSGLADLNGYPVMVALDLGAQHNNATPADYAAAAAGQYNAAFEKTVQSLVPYAASIYAIRIDVEFNLHGQGDPWATAYTYAGPTTFIAAFNALADICRRVLPHAKIVWNPNISNGADVVPYYPRKGALVGIDCYFQPQYNTTFDSFKGGTNGLDAFVALAASAGVPWGLCECADLWPGTTNGDKLWTYAKANSAAFLSYWDSDDALGIGNGGNVSPKLVGAKEAAFLAAWGTPYGGTYWKPLIPVTDLAGY